MKKLILTLLGAAGLTSVSALTASAQILVDYDATGSVFTADSTSINANLTATSLLANAPAAVTGSYDITSGDPNGTDGGTTGSGTGIQKFEIYTGGGTGPGSTSNPNYLFTPFNAGTTTLAQALSAGAFFSFTITPNAGESMSISSISLNLAMDGSTGPRGFEITSSLTGSTDLLSNSTSSTTFSNFSATLSGNSSLQSITGPVSFQVYGYTPSTGQGINYDDITVDGTLNTVVVPDPSTYSLLLLGAAVLLFRQIRARRGMI